MDGFNFEGADAVGAADAAGMAASLGLPGASTAAGGAAMGTGTGQHGFVPVANPGGIGGYFVQLKNWLDAPFVGGLSPEGVVLLIGIIIVGIIFWNLVLFHIRIASEAI
jgi:hypothetical protein